MPVTWQKGKTLNSRNGFCRCIFLWPPTREESYNSAVLLPHPVDHAAVFPPRGGCVLVQSHTCLSLSVWAKCIYQTSKTLHYVLGSGWKKNGNIPCCQGVCNLGDNGTKRYRVPGIFWDGIMFTRAGPALLRRYCLNSSLNTDKGFAEGKGWGSACQTKQRVSMSQTPGTRSSVACAQNPSGSSQLLFKTVIFNRCAARVFKPPSTWLLKSGTLTSFPSDCQVRKWQQPAQ